MGRPGERTGETTHYEMREQMFAIGKDFWIEKDREGAFKVDGKAFRLRTTLVLQTPSGDELLTIQEKKFTLRKKMEIKHDGKTVATVKKALFSFPRDRYSINVEGGQDVQVTGDIVDHEFTLERGGDQVAQVSKRWVSMRDTYGVDVAPGQDDALILACTVCLDQMS